MQTSDLWKIELLEIEMFDHLTVGRLMFNWIVLDVAIPVTISLYANKWLILERIINVRL